MSKILLVESEELLRVRLAYLLEGAGLATVTASNGPEALALFETSAPDLLLLDLALPGMSGFEVCQRIRQRSPIPILLLSEQADESALVAGLELGADDCIGKPVRIRELLARSNAALRRPQLQRASGPPVGQAVLQSGDLTVDLAARTVDLAGKPLRLKPRTIALLGHLMQHPGHVFARNELLRQLWPVGSDQNQRTIDVHVLWIRQQIEEDPKRPQRLRTLRTRGYRFEG